MSPERTINIMNQLGVGVLTVGFRACRLPLAIACLAWIIASAQAQVGGKVSFKDLRGREFKDAEVLRVEPGTLVLMTETGISRVPASSLPEEIRKQFQLTDTAPTPASGATSSPRAPAESATRSSEEIQAAHIDIKISKLNSEIEGMENSRVLLKGDYDKALAAAKVRLETEYAVAMREFQVKMDRQGRRERPTIGRASLEPPMQRDPATDPDVVRLKNRLVGYEGQLEERRGWLKQLHAQRKEMDDRLDSVANANREAQLQAKAQQRAADALRLKAEEQRLLDEQMQSKAEADRLAEVEAKARREEVEQKLEEKRKRAAEGIALVHQLAENGKTGESLVAFQTLVAERDLWNFDGSQPASRLCDAGLSLFDAARKSGDLAVAATALRTAVNLNSDSPKILERLIAFFDEAKGFLAKGDFRALMRHIAFIEGSGIEDHHLCVRNKQELSNLALAEGWDSLRKFNVVRAGAAVDVARKLWDRNPGLGWLRNSISAVFLVGIVVGFVVIAKVSEKTYWWLTNR